MAATECRPVEDLCTLPESFDARPLDEQAALVLACHTINTTEYAKCVTKHQRMLEWARQVATQK